MPLRAGKMSRQLEGIGFVRGVGHPSVFWHRARELCTIVHGDDYATVGSLKSLAWMGAKLEGDLT